MANSLIIKTLNSIKRNPKFFTTFTSQSQIQTHLFSSIANTQEPQSEDSSSSTFTFSADGKTHKNDNNNNNSIYVKASSSNSQTTLSLSVTMPMSFMTGSIVGKRFYNEVKVRKSDDGVGWSVMFDYRTLKNIPKKWYVLHDLGFIFLGMFFMIWLLKMWSHGSNEKSRELRQEPGTIDFGLRPFFRSLRTLISAGSVVESTRK